tara:strand:+ start:64 stop:1035 length:972 start_codon:yes stop_codon:yes gene_type:complete
MYKNFPNVNSNNNKFRYTLDQAFGGGEIAQIDIPLELTNQNYSNLNDLATDFGDSLASKLAIHLNKTATVNVASVRPKSSTTIAGTTDNIITFDIDITGHGITADLVIQFKIRDGDIFELLGGDRIRDSVATPDTTTASITADTTTSADKITITCKFPAQLSTQQNIYLRTNVSNTNIQTESFDAGNSDVVGGNNIMGGSRILGKIIIDNEFATFTSGTQMEYFVNLLQKQVNTLQLYLTDSHGRPLPFITGQTTLGNASFECVVKVDTIQYMSAMNNTLDSGGVKNTIPARFGTEPLKHIDYGRDNYTDHLEIRMNNMKLGR